MQQNELIEKQKGFIEMIRIHLRAEAKKREEDHKQDMMTQDRRREWRYGDPEDCWEQTNEEKEFGISPPEKPKPFNRNDIIDLDE